MALSPGHLLVLSFFATPCSVCNDEGDVRFGGVVISGILWYDLDDKGMGGHGLAGVKGGTGLLVIPIGPARSGVALVQSGESPGALALARFGAGSGSDKERGGVRALRRGVGFVPWCKRWFKSATRHARGRWSVVASWETCEQRRKT